MKLVDIRVASRAWVLRVCAATLLLIFTISVYFSLRAGATTPFVVIRSGFNTPASVAADPVTPDFLKDVGQKLQWDPFGGNEALDAIGSPSTTN